MTRSVSGSRSAGREGTSTAGGRRVLRYAALFYAVAAVVSGMTVTVLGAVVGAVITSILSGIIFSLLDER